eukprot:NODE_101_length_20473_cov_0.516590.p14 type:complete len:107 gc:universal NODE_101_length_20473_cov_0.516590:2901-2581(-)
MLTIAVLVAESANFENAVAVQSCVVNCNSLERTLWSDCYKKCNEGLSTGFIVTNSTSHSEIGNNFGNVNKSVIANLPTDIDPKYYKKSSATYEVPFKIIILSLLCL